MNAHPDRTVFLPMTRSMRMRIEATIEQLLELLDEIDCGSDIGDDWGAEANLDDVFEGGA